MGTLGLLILLSAGSLARITAEPTPELVMLHDLNSDHDRRHLDSGLPSYLEFNLRRKDGDIRLTLTENRNVNRNPPIYEFVKDTYGKQILVERQDVPDLTERFYHDFQSRGVFAVECAISDDGPCRRMITGSLFIGGRDFDITPALDQKSKRGFEKFATPHYLQEKIIKKSGLMNDYYTPGFTGLEKGHYVLKDAEGLLEKIGQARHKREDAETQYTIQLYMILDGILTTRYYESAIPTENRTREQETLYQVKRLACLIAFGMDLTYGTISDPKLKISIKLEGIGYYQQLPGPNVTDPPTQYFKSEDGTYQLDGYKYLLVDIAAWMQSHVMSSYDHVMWLTGGDLYFEEDKVKNLGLLGLSPISFVCNDTYKTSLIGYSGSFFETTMTAAHELGHNLGAVHDGVQSAKTCPASSMYIMTAESKPIDENEAYSINPWRFSNCTVSSIKELMANLTKGGKNCLVNGGKYYNDAEYNNYTEKFAGEIYDVHKQCELLWGKSAKFCGTVNTTQVCLVMKCSDKNGKCRDDLYDHIHRAAIGTTCGTNKWCMSGACVAKDWQAPPGCEDAGDGVHSCKDLKKTYEYSFEEFCYTWKQSCCKMCLNVGVKYRLEDGPYRYSGRVGVFYNGEWGTVCDDNFEQKDAEVLCHSLGYSDGRVLRKSFGAGTGRIWMDDLDCDGTEDGLGFCKFPGWGNVSTSCDHNRDVSVDCGPYASAYPEFCEDLNVNGTRCAVLAFIASFGSAEQICNEPKWKTTCCKTCRKLTSVAQTNSANTDTSQPQAPDGSPMDDSPESGNFPTIPTTVASTAPTTAAPTSPTTIPTTAAPTTTTTTPAPSTPTTAATTTTIITTPTTTTTTQDWPEQKRK